MHDGAYLHAGLLPENLYGHTKKVAFLRASLDRLRHERAGAGLRILDIGCGNGYAVTRFLAHGGDQVAGIDLHEPSIAYASQHFASEGLRFELRSVEELATAPGTYDAIVFADVLEHVDDPAQTLTMAVRQLARNGRILVSIPNGRGPFENECYLRKMPVIGWVLSICARALGRVQRIWGPVQALQGDDVDPRPYNASSGHLHFFTRTRMRELAAEAGLTPVGWRNLSFLCGPFSGEVLPQSRSVCRWNTDVADRLPYWAASAWYFELAPINHY